MTYTGRIQNGVAVLDDGVRLPEGTAVLIAPAEAKTPGEALADVIGKGKGLPQDGSVQHDHYIYGTPTR